MDIAEFLTRCLDEDEDEARDLLRAHPAPWRVGSPSEVRDAAGQLVVADEHHWTPMQYIGRHDPARVLADIAAKRAILDALTRNVEYWQSDDHTHAAATEALEAAQRHLAAPYADRPGYKPEWAVEA